MKPRVSVQAEATNQYLALVHSRLYGMEDSYRLGVKVRETVDST
jgi:hypothetical protein